MGRAVLGAAAVVAAAAVGVLALWFVEGAEWLAPLASVTLALAMASIVLVVESRARAAHRWTAVLDAYAEREIARESRRRIRAVAAIASQP
jgi:hypothetical protein